MSQCGDRQFQQDFAGFHPSMSNDNSQIITDCAPTQTLAPATDQNGSPRAAQYTTESFSIRRSSNADSQTLETSPSCPDLSPHYSVSVDVHSESDPRFKFPQLGLSGNVISVNFCIPYKIKHAVGANWELVPRKGTSALFDSFAHLSSEESEWNHTVVGWTGEIEQLPPMTRNATSFTSIPLNKASAPIPVDAKSRSEKPHDSFQVTVSRNDRISLAWQLSLEQGGRVYPVWLPDHATADGINTFRSQERWRCYGDQTLFPLFHYKQVEPSDGRAVAEAWKDYEQLNYAFADAVMSVYRPGDIVMVHDYHLLLLPQILRRRLPNIFLGLFLHTPFPSSEYFRSLPTRERLVAGMLGADMIGFQTHSYAIHFKFCCERTLDLIASEEGVDYEGNHAAFEVFPIGINACATLQSAFDPGVDDKIAKLMDEKVYLGRKVIVGRDRLDSARGVAQKLHAFEFFLEKYPEWLEKVILVQVTSPTSTDKREEKRDKIDNIVSRINGNLGHLGYTPVHYYPQYLSKDEYFALLRMADVGLITSVRDGMNTTALEYVVSQRDKKSPLIISEFSGTASSLQHAININPWDLGGVATKIHEALTMSNQRKAALHHELYHAVTENSVQRWTTKCMNRLIANLVANNRYQRTPALDRDELLRQYCVSSRRLFMFDYDGTLTPIVTDPATAVPNERTLHTVEKLATDPHNAVWIISGRDQSFLDEHMGHISSLGLSAEHGSFMRAPCSTQWDSLAERMDISWQGEAMDIFNRYSEAIHGSYVEQKKIAVTWHYRKAEDANLARLEAQKCQKELNQTVGKKFDVKVMAGKANVEVRPHFVNKGEIVKRLLQAYGEGDDCAPDFVLCLGDDSTDEDMFQKLRCSDLPPERVFAVTVGASSKPTLASSYVAEPEDVIAVIASLNSHSHGINTGAESEAH